MSTIKIKNKEYELKYTFNSFKFMQDFDVSAMEEVEKKPFKIIPVLEMLLLGAVNHNAKQVVKEQDIQDYLEEYIASEDGDITALLETLMQLLQESSFFKSLQRK